MKTISEEDGWQRTLEEIYLESNLNESSNGRSKEK